MIIRKAINRGKASHGWLNANYTFSFSRYYDPKWTGFGPLLVMNEDYIDGGRGFPPHSHDNMEILTIVMNGSIKHQDDLGTSETIRPGEIQLMSAGTGITHSEMNGEEDLTTRLYQIWIRPNVRNITPQYQSKKVDLKSPLSLIVSPDQKDGSLLIHQNVRIYLGTIKKGESMTLAHGWIQVIKGQVKIGSETLIESDGAGVERETLKAEALEDSEVLYFSF